MVFSGTALEEDQKSAKCLCWGTARLAPRTSDGEFLQITASFGGTVFDQRDHDITQALGGATEALCEALNSGRNQVVRKSMSDNDDERNY